MKTCPYCGAKNEEPNIDFSTSVPTKNLPEAKKNAVVCWKCKRTLSTDSYIGITKRGP